MLRKLARHRFSLAIILMQTEPIKFQRDQNWFKNHNYLHSSKLRDVDEKVFDFLVSATTTKHPDLKISLLNQPVTDPILPRTTYYFDLYRQGKNWRKNFFSQIVHHPSLTQQQVFFFDPNAGLRYRIRSSNPVSDYLEFDDLMKFDILIPDKTIVIFQPNYSQQLNITPTRSKQHRNHLLLVDKLQSLVHSGDDLAILYSGVTFYYFIIRNNPVLTELLPFIANQIQFQHKLITTKAI